METSDHRSLPGYFCDQAVAAPTVRLAEKRAPQWMRRRLLLVLRAIEYPHACRSPLHGLRPGSRACR